MAKTSIRLKQRLARQARVRSAIKGTTVKPRLSVFRSLKHIYVQVIDDTCGKTLATASSTEKEFMSSFAGGDKKIKAALVGKMIARRCVEKNIKKVVFDRNGFLYCGRVAKLADAAREGGLEF